MPPEPAIAPLQIAVTPGTISPFLTALLSKQRIEEPQTPVHIVETSTEEQYQGIKDGRYCLGLSLAAEEHHPSVQSLPLWQDELAVAIPARSPLLRFADIPLQEVVQYPIVMWRKGACHPIDSQIKSLLESTATQLNIVDWVESFELMMILIASGYGIGIHTKSRIKALRGLDIVMRPLSGGTHLVTICLISPYQPLSEAAERIVRRAKAIKLYSQ
ncbi:LysR substrate-binding domain-containing protein [Pseudomonas citronellolis]|uniref:LysR substrate-binding domain-containing protein n=1 Tax=Pseudomonas citronellolis TaxID=53408 RepID=UPI0009F65E6D|nr:LysR substrate-binding domain-containing protein [Pseudomonas humi]